MIHVLAFLGGIFMIYGAIRLLGDLIWLIDGLGDNRRFKP